MLDVILDDDQHLINYVIYEYEDDDEVAEPDDDEVDDVYEHDHFYDILKNIV